MPSLPKVEQIFRAHLKHLAELENDIERNADIAKLYSAYMAPVNIHELRELQLRELFSFSVIDYIQSKLFIELLYSAFMCITSDKW